MSYNGRNIKNDKCSTKLDVLQNVNLQSIEPVLLIKKLNNFFEGVFFSKVY